MKQKAFPALCVVLQHRLLLRQTPEHVGRPLRLLKGAAHNGCGFWWSDRLRSAKASGKDSLFLSQLLSGVG